MAVTVLGLGEMGSALAAAFLAGGQRTAVWNRTPGRAEALVARGAVGSSSVEDAVAGADLVVVNVKGNEAARAVLASAGSLAGRVVVNLTDGTSSEARGLSAWVAARGARYVHGQIMTIAPAIGHPDSVVFYGGDEAAFNDHRGVLLLLGGRATFLGDDAGVPALFGMAMNGTMWGTLNGFLHAAALLSSQGVEVKRFVEAASASLTGLLGYLPSLAEEVDRGEHAVPFGALKHHLPAVDDLVRESRERGIDAGLPSYTSELVRAAVEAGHGDDSYSRLVERFRSAS
ncbi:3-hydroxyisobutyrate dehydrogenase-like beta-hydroxyacid dehydrogenase [Saccharothrix saharensis]|uniref:3-hydroxyisobutyrate dehydrogenase-like beta-hydroxyacid dehydrogenase n=1 Tax=Saccharothrix saharensis TaxID=571190 RepID=A0A543JJ88_9PSEU|nr:3-hydroxyisobutyrate dehydrogenase-like beta-hydroxyacid dehydrogenase [Saccharothrix saharensis]